MKEFKLTIEMLPKGAWDNDFSKTLPQKEWDIVRNACYQKANHKCQILMPLGYRLQARCYPKPCPPNYTRTGIRTIMLS